VFAAVVDAAPKRDMMRVVAVALGEEEEDGGGAGSLLKSVFGRRG
jgi:hypothetical protein